MLPRGEIVFPVMQAPFQKGIGEQERKQEIKNVVVLVKNDLKSSKCIPSLLN